MAADGSDTSEAKRTTPVHIRDARGQEVTQLDPVELRLLRRHDVIDADTLRAIVEEVGSGLEERSRRFVPVLVIGASILALVLIVQLIDHAIHGDLWGFFSGRNIALANVWLLIMVFWARAKQGRFGRIRKIMLKHHRCPHCGYDLRGLPVDASDGATRCPECGCAWKSDRSVDDGADTDS
jgi:hypothetical protein